jgi:hypothetical protein
MKYVSPFLVAAAALGLSDAQVIDRQFIARVHGSQCSQMAEKVNVLKLAIEGAAATSREPLSRMLDMQDRSVEGHSETCFVAFTGSDALRAEVVKQSGVMYVEQDQIMTALVTPGSWGQDRIDQATGVNGDYSPDFTGAGVSVYVLDTGVNIDHQDLQGRASYGADFINESSPTDQNGHGSHCAGTVAGTTFGVAKQAKIVAVKVLSGSGSGSNVGVLNGINWAAQNAPVPSVISMSLGGGKSQATDDAVTAAFNKGHIVTVAAGNSNTNACSTSPAAAGGKGGVITVMATEKPSGNSDVRASYSSYGPCCDIFAPGSNIVSIWKGSSVATNTISGTSMATPHVAGVAAQLLQKYNMNRDAALAALFEISSKNTVSNPQSGSPNRMLQTPRNDGAPTPPPSSPPVAAPTETVPPTPQPTKAPTSAIWTCPNTWFGSKDGCDCECGTFDPDCSGSYTELYCNGRAARSNEVCDFSTLKCVTTSMTTADTLAAGRTIEAYPDKTAAPAATNSTLLYAGVGAGCAFVALLVGAVVVSKRRSAARTETAKPTSVVALPDL